MKSNIEYKGSFRHDRFIKALSADYYKLDNRSMEDLIKQSALLASHIKYYNENNQVEGNWEVFFEDIYNYLNHKVKTEEIKMMEKNAQMPPHLALYLAFIKVFRIAQDELNRFTKRHLDYYYKNILKFEHKKEIADQVYLFLEINKNETKVPINKGVLFDGGNDNQGKKRLYQSDFNLILNQSKIEKTQSLKTIIEEKEASAEIRLSVQDDVLTDKEEKEAVIGFAISSPLFYLKDGNRELYFKLENIIKKKNFKDKILKKRNEWELFKNERYKKLIEENTIVEYTTVEGWQRVEWSNFNHNSVLKIEVSQALPPFVSYDEAVHKMQLAAQDPTIRILFKNKINCDKKEMELLFHLPANLVRYIDVNVENSKDLILYNDSGRLNNEIPFMPFGGNPLVGSSQFFIGNNKIFNKHLKSFKFNIKWKGMPDNLKQYYQSYQEGLSLLSQEQYQSFRNTDFSTFDKESLPGKFFFLDKGEWEKMPDNLRQYEKLCEEGLSLLSQEQYQSFGNTHSFFKKEGLPGKYIYSDQAERKYSDNITDEDAFSNQGNAIRETLTEYSHQTKSGFIKVVSSFDYGHQLYTVLLSKVMMTNTLNKIKAASPEENDNTENTFYTLPEKPYTPEMQDFSINYNASSRKSSDKGYQIFSIHPFKNMEMANKRESLLSLISEKNNGFINEKHYYFTIKDFLSAGELNIFFEIDNPNPYDEKNNVIWSYFFENQWKKIENNMIIRNTTQNFSRTGITTFIIPDSAIDNHQIYLRLSIFNRNNDFPEILNIRTNCVTATFLNQNNELSHLKSGLLENSIQKFVEANSQIKSIEQPYISQGGQEVEDDANFYARISERLQHKNRASTAKDYEKLILEHFPQISYVLCLPHCKNNAGKINDFSPGDILLLVRPDKSTIRQNNSLKPIVPEQMLKDIKDYVRELSSPHVNIDVSNFSYKEIEIKCEVQLRKEFSDIDFYRDKLNTDLKYFIAPWTKSQENGTNKESIFMSKNVAEVYFFLENLEYIDFVVLAEVVIGKEIYSISDKTIPKEIDEIFTSSGNHNIRIVNNG